MKLSVVLGLLYALTGLAVITVAFSYRVMYVPDALLAVLMVVGGVKLARGTAGPFALALLLLASGAAVYGGAWHLAISPDDASIPIPHYRHMSSLIDSTYGVYMVPFGTISVALLIWVGNAVAGVVETPAEQKASSPDPTKLLQAHGLTNVAFGLVFVLLAWSGRSLNDGALAAVLIVGGVLFWDRPSSRLASSLLFSATGGVLYLGLLDMTSEAYRNGFMPSRFFSPLHFAFGVFLTAFGILSVVILRKGSIKTRD